MLSTPSIPSMTMYNGQTQLSQETSDNQVSQIQYLGSLTLLLTNQIMIK